MELDSVLPGYAVQLTPEKVKQLKDANEFHPNWAVDGLVKEVRDDGTIRVVLGEGDAQTELEVTAKDLNLL